MIERYLAWQPLAPRVKGAIAAGAMLGTGFLAMNAFWKFGEWAPSQPGLWDYRSATLGDGVLLPLLAYALITEGAKLPRVRGESYWRAGLALTGIIGGVLVVRAWLMDPAASTNWTQPRQGELNAAGWWHAAFLALASGALLAMAGTLALRLRAATDEQVQQFARSPNAMLAIASAIGFAGLVLLDNIQSTLNRSNVASIGASAGATVLALILLARYLRSKGIDIAARLKWSVLNAACFIIIGDLIVRRNSGVAGFALVVAVSLCLGAALDARFRQDPYWIMRILPGILLIWLGLIGIARNHVATPHIAGITSVLLLLLLLALTPTLLGYWRWGSRAADVSGKPAIWAYRNHRLGKSISPVFLLIAAPLIWAGLAALYSRDSDVLGGQSILIIGVAISFLGIRMGKVGLRYHRELVIEQELLRNDVWSKLVVLIVFAIGVFAALLWLVSIELESSVRAIEPLHVVDMTTHGTVAITSAGAAMMLGLLLFRRRTESVSPGVTIILGSLVMLGVGYWGLTPWLIAQDALAPLDASYGSLSWVFRFMSAVYLSVLLGWFARASLLSNPIRLQLRLASPLHQLIALVTALSVGSVYLWTLVIGFWKVNVLDTWRFVGIASYAFVGGILAWAFAAHVLDWSAPPRRYTTHAPWQNAIQDASLFSALTLFSYFTFRAIGAALEDFGEAIQEINVLLGFGFPLAIAYLYKRIVANNQQHLVAETDRAVRWSAEENMERLAALGAWLSRQERFAQRICPTIPVMLWWEECSENDTCQSFKHMAPAATLSTAAHAATPDVQAGSSAARQHIEHEAETPVPAP